MLDRLSGRGRSSRARSALGLGVSVLLHLALFALVLTGADAVRRGGWDAPDRQAADGPGARLPGASVGAGAPPETPSPGGLADDAVLELGLPPDAPLPGLDQPLRVALPDTLELGRSVPIRLRLPPNARSDDPVVRVQAGDGEREVRIAPVRSASLAGSGFVVGARGSALQLADSARPLRWEWSVRPTEPGLQRLELRLEAVAQVEGQRRVVSLFRREQEIFVRQGLLQRVSRFFAHHWTWLSLVFLVLLLLWLRERVGRTEARSLARSQSRSSE